MKSEVCLPMSKRHQIVFSGWREETWFSAERFEAGHLDHLVLHYGHHQVEDTPCIVIYNTGDLVSPNKPITQRLVPVDKVWKLVFSTSYQNHHHHQSLCQTNLFLNEHHSRCRQRSLWARLQSIWSTLTPPRCCSPPGTFGRHLIDRD